MFLTTATGRCSIAPAEARTTAGVTRAALCAGTTIPVAPAASPVRATAPRLCGSVTWSRQTSRGESLAAKTIRFVEITACPRLSSLLREGNEVRRCRSRFGELAEPEQLQPPPQGRGSAASPPVVEERERLGRVEVVVEHAGERLAVDLFRLGFE